MADGPQALTKSVIDGGNLGAADERIDVDSRTNFLGQLGRKNRKDG
jgi:hypothetical protein